MESGEALEALDPVGARFGARAAAPGPVQVVAAHRIRELAHGLPAQDLETHERFDEYMSAYDEALEATSTRWAPWHVVPADRNWVKSLAVAALVVDALERMDPKLPDPEPGIEDLEIV